MKDKGKRMVHQCHKSYNKSQYDCPNCGMRILINMEDGK